MSGLRTRIDVQKAEAGHINVAWGLSATDPVTPVTDELWLLYSLQARPALPNPQKFGPGVTHELSVYSLDGSRIAFDKVLWNQKGLIPELPAQVAFQFIAHGDHDALKQVQLMMGAMLAGLCHIPTTSADWKAQFPGMVPLPNARTAFRPPNTKS